MTIADDFFELENYHSMANRVVAAKARVFASIESARDKLKNTRIESAADFDRLRAELLILLGDDASQENRS